MLTLSKDDFLYDDFFPSISAQLATTKFEGKEYTCFVEGKDDQLFWEKILLKDKAHLFKIKILDGVKNIDKANKEIKLTRDLISEELKKEENKTDFCFLLDKDYRKILKDELPKEQNVVYTYGYSIENTLFCPVGLIELLNVYLRVTQSNFALRKQLETEILDFFKNFNKLKTLIAIEIKNQEECLKLMKKEISQYESIVGIPKQIGELIDMNGTLNLKDEYIEKIQTKAETKFSPEEVKEYEKKIDNVFNFLKGHFYGDCSQQIINKLIKKYTKILNIKATQVSKENFYQLSLGKCNTCLIQKCTQKKYYEKKRKELFKKLKIKD